MRTAKLILICSLTLVSSICFAKGEGGMGGNGGGGETIFYQIGFNIQHWLTRQEGMNRLENSLGLPRAQMSGSTLLRSFQQSFYSARVKFVPEHLLKQECRRTQNSLMCELSMNGRTCMNRIFAIACNEDLFMAKRPEEQYAIVFHEYLGVAGIETNDFFDYSQYLYSPRISNFVYRTQNGKWKLQMEDDGESKLCTRTRITRIEDALFQPYVILPPSGALDVNPILTHQGIRCLLGTYSPNGDFQIRQVSDRFRESRPDYRPLFLENELNEICQSFGFRRGQLYYDPKSPLPVIHNERRHSERDFQFIEPKLLNPRTPGFYLKKCTSGLFDRLPCDTPIYAITRFSCIR